MKVTGVKCNGCGDIIYSRTRHDFHYCSCGKTSVDGGFDYLKYGWDPSIGKPETVDVDIETTVKELYDDWNRRKDRYGRVAATKD